MLRAASSPRREGMGGNSESFVVVVVISEMIVPLGWLSSENGDTRPSSFLMSPSAVSLEDLTSSSGENLYTGVHESAGPRRGVGWDTAKSRGESPERLETPLGETEARGRKMGDLVGVKQSSVPAEEISPSFIITPVGWERRFVEVVLLFILFKASLAL